MEDRQTAVKVLSVWSHEPEAPERQTRVLLIRQSNYALVKEKAALSGTALHAL